MSFGLGRRTAATIPSAVVVDASTPWLAAADGNLSLLQSSLTQLRLSPAQAADENGYTLLQAAASYSQIAVMEWLVLRQVPNSSSAVVNAVDRDGDTALHYASTVEAAKFLVQVAHIDASVRNGAGQTALESKQAELDEMMQDEDNDEDDQDFVNLRSLVEYLKSLSSVPQ